MHSSRLNSKVGSMPKDSGLWHQAQRRLQPFMNTVVRMPGPSWVEYLCMLNTLPEAKAQPPLYARRTPLMVTALSSLR